ncbi:hypothetical protein [Synechococcus sp. PROS-U-1]|uniref:hypothetical protein n=1 Tax=Synechococcus sp. PROS-U-1 TaxID=1400866 RepID=UPI001CA438C5|nr:hypothetical protein [Synechococcus sp. PROS-U-1]
MQDADPLNAKTAHYIGDIGHDASLLWVEEDESERMQRQIRGSHHEQHFQLNATCFHEIGRWSEEAPKSVVIGARERPATTLE